MAEDYSNSPRLKLNSTAWVGVFAFISFSAFGLYLILEAGSVDLSTAGSLGDFMGGMLNPIIALLGIFLLAMTLHQNSIALDLTRIELKKSAEQMEISAEALQRQEQHMRLESSERTVVFICNEIEKEYNHRPQPVKWEGTVLTEEPSLLDYSHQAIAATSGRQMAEAYHQFDQFSLRFVRALMLFVMLKRATEVDEELIKSHLHMVIACKLDMGFLCVTYTEVHRLTQKNCELYSIEELQQVLAFLDAVTTLNALKASSSEVFINLSV